MEVTPEIPQEEQYPRIGIAWDDNYGIVLDTYGKLTRSHPTPLEQVRAATLAVVNTFGAIASPKSDVKLQHMSGPVMMLRVYYLMFENRDGWLMAFWFSVVLNVNLALLNLIPMPVLDGGHITLAIIEALRRRPVNARVLEIVQTACAGVRAANGLRMVAEVEMSVMRTLEGTDVFVVPPRHVGRRREQFELLRPQRRSAVGSR